MTIASATLLLFLVLDPLGNVPFFLSALKRVAPERQRLVLFRELTVALVVLVAFLFAGPPVLGLLKISGPALTVAGGVVLFLIAIKMIFPSGDHAAQDELAGEPFIVPLAIPYTAGPSALATVLLLMSSEPTRWAEWLLAVVLAWLATSVVIVFASAFRRYLGQRGLIAMERLMGMVLVTIAIQMLMSGIAQFLAEPGGGGH